MFDDSKFKQIIGIPLLLIFVWILGGRLIENMSGTGGGTPMVILAILVILVILMLSFKQIRD